MTKKQLDKIGRAVNRATQQTLHLSTLLNEYPAIAQQVGAASDELYAAVKKLDNIRDEMRAPVHP